MKKYPGLVFLTDYKNVKMCLNVHHVEGLRDSYSLYEPRELPGTVLVFMASNEVMTISGSMEEVLEALVEAGWGEK